MIPIKDNIQKFGMDPILEDQIRIYETKKSILDRPSITGDTVTRLSIPIRGRGKSSEEGQREFGRNVVKEETTQKTT